MQLHAGPGAQNFGLFVQCRSNPYKLSRLQPFRPYNCPALACDSSRFGRLSRTRGVKTNFVPITDNSDKVQPDWLAGP